MQRLKCKHKKKKKEEIFIKKSFPAWIMPSNYVIRAQKVLQKVAKAFFYWLVSVPQKSIVKLGQNQKFLTGSQVP